MPHALAHPDTPWEVFGFEAAPLITPHAERCCQAMSRGEPIPEAPVPPTGSSAELAKQRDALGCTPPRRNRTFDMNAEHYWWLECTLAKLRPALSRLKPDPALNEELLARRMREARTSCPPSNHRDRYTLLPAAVGAKDGTTHVYGGPEALVRGGVVPNPNFKVRRRRKMKHAPVPTTALSLIPACLAEPQVGEYRPCQCAGGACGRSRQVGAGDLSSRRFCGPQACTSAILQRSTHTRCPDPLSA